MPVTILAVISTIVHALNSSVWYKFAGDLKKKKLKMPSSDSFFVVLIEQLYADRLEIQLSKGWHAL